MDYISNVPIYGWIVLGVGILAVIPYFYIYSLRKQLKKFKEAHVALQSFMNGKTLDQLLERYIKEVENTEKQMENQNLRLIKVEEKLRKSVDRAELVRFNAFDNMGSDLSFALALLNQEGNGVVLSSINSREESRVYAKPVTEGQSTYHLSNEEKQALEKAQNTLHV
ncbi:DUF4446 family protein [Desulfitobacterium metallireducens]|uniref:DUF4446 domain-containing protein n=1 Tax=Desulfitobacterium metallireducens DSM 15288 TaxID=871968 RepID=W0EFQ6_9FIRM|nr:DUF4446 family protein [Desulfitobacterium metallireducens]AHF08343.1 hypothetical protein DESME_15855 [Desulfitobacterium metallireducens DSM 15288]